jgi:hypothetical protein
MYVSNESTHTCISKRGRPLKPFTQYLIAVTNQIITAHPYINPKELCRILYYNTKTEISRSYSKILLHRYRRKYHVKLPSWKYQNNLYPKNPNHKLNNKLQRHYIHSQQVVTNIHDFILTYLYAKEPSKTVNNVNNTNQFFQKKFGYKNICPKHRYSDIENLSIRDKRGRLRRFIQRLKNKTTPIQHNHIHYHGQKRKRIEYHIGSHKNHDLTKFLCAKMKIPYKMRLYLENGQFFSTDCSGIDVSDLRLLYVLFYVNLEKGLEGIQLLKHCFKHGKMMVGNEVKHVW